MLRQPYFASGTFGRRCRPLGEDARIAHHAAKRTPLAVVATGALQTGCVTSPFACFASAPCGRSGAHAFRV
jgi:hypothetical protein